MSRFHNAIMDLIRTRNNRKNILQKINYCCCFFLLLLCICFLSLSAEMEWKGAHHLNDKEKEMIPLEHLLFKWIQWALSFFLFCFVFLHSFRSNFFFCFILYAYILFSDVFFVVCLMKRNTSSFASATTMTTKPKKKQS